MRLIWRLRKIFPAGCPTTTKLTGDTVDLTLNGQHICSRELEPTNQRTFGLFHYADQAEARVKNIRWRGDWPKQLPDVSEQELVDDPLQPLIDQLADLPVVLDHNFEDGLPQDPFFISNGKRGTHIKEQHDGVFVARPAGDGTHIAIRPDAARGTRKFAATCTALRSWRRPR